MTDIRIKVLNALKAIAEEASEDELYTTLLTVDSLDSWYSDIDLDLDDLIIKIEENIKK